MKTLNQTRYQEHGGKGKPRASDYDEYEIEVPNLKNYSFSLKPVLLNTFPNYQTFWTILAITAAILITAYGEGLSRSVGAF